MQKKLNTQKLLQKTAKILSKLNQKRDRGIFIKRFSLDGRKKLTLQALGDKYDITRERVRQIVDVNLTVLKKTDACHLMEEEFNVIRQYFLARGGVAPERKIVRDFFIDQDQKQEAHFLFLLHLGQNFILSKENKTFYRYWGLSHEHIKKAKNSIEEIVNFLKRKKRVFNEQNFLESLNQDPKNSLNLEHSVFLNFLHISKKIGYNAFNEWGLNLWKEIQPSGTRAKAYLVLKHQGSPMHFQEITNKINQIKIGRPAHPGTLHNELIKDPRFVLVGRGLYALKIWGYRKGRVKEILIDLLKQNKNEMEKNELINEVLKQRIVQRQTVILGLKANEFKILKNGIVKLKV